VVNESLEFLSDHSFDELGLFDSGGSIEKGLGREASHELVVTCEGADHYVLMNISDSVVEVQVESDGLAIVEANSHLSLRLALIDHRFAVFTFCVNDSSLGLNLAAHRNTGPREGDVLGLWGRSWRPVVFSLLILDVESKHGDFALCLGLGELLIVHLFQFLRNLLVLKTSHELLLSGAIVVSER
jgi:hypothetical protein